MVKIDKLFVNIAMIKIIVGDLFQAVEVYQKLQSLADLNSGACVTSAQEGEISTTGQPGKSSS